MVVKILAVASFVILPLSVSLWYKSHSAPEHYRTDVTEYKSLRVFLRDGVFGLRVLNMPTKTNLHSENRTPLNFGTFPDRSFMLSSQRNGPYRITWVVFPFWFSTGLLMFFGITPIVRGPILRWWRRWHGACEVCGYNLRGNRSGRCSECGTRFR